MGEPGGGDRKVSIFQPRIDEENLDDDNISAIADDLTQSATALECGVETILSHDSMLPQSSFIIKPALEDKFKANPVKDVIQSVLAEHLGGNTYDSDSAKKWTIKIANDVNEKIRALRMKRYKHIVQVTIGELKGAGVKSGVRCLWDSETDGYTSDIFMNDTIFAVVVVFAIYLY